MNDSEFLKHKASLLWALQNTHTLEEAISKLNARENQKPAKNPEVKDGIPQEYLVSIYD